VGEIIPARIRGILYHTGYGFPVVDVEAEGWVHGKLVTLNDPAAAFAMLDRYEGVSDDGFGLYRRIEVEAFPDNEESSAIRTQVYAVNPSQLHTIPGLERVADGDWLKYVKEQHRL
jgi:gamma-glutamylcyclotransferase (GGCT)/AIG2-like uncharacterized protein YtfP